MDTVLLCLSTVVLIIYTWLRATSDPAPSPRDRVPGGDTHHDGPVHRDDMGMSEQQPLSLGTPPDSLDQYPMAAMTGALPLLEHVDDSVTTRSIAQIGATDSIPRAAASAHHTSGSTPARAPWTALWLDRRERGLVAGAASLILLSLAVWNLVHELPSPSTASGTTGTSAITPSATSSQTYAPLNGAPLDVVRMIGRGVGLRVPRGAIALPNRRIAVVDTGNARLVILDRDGRTTRATQAGHLAQLFALASDGVSIYVLDAGRGVIERYNLNGQFVGDLVRNPSLLNDGRGLAVAAGVLYVASPRANSIAEFALPSGKPRRIFTSPPGDTDRNRYNQPSDVAVDLEGGIYAIDVDDYIKLRQSTGEFIQRWIIPGFVTVNPVRVLPLRPGHLLASDPSGALLSYVGTDAPIRYPFRWRGKVLTNVDPQGLSRLANGNILVADAIGNRLLEVRPP